ncbi:MAG TPA: molecular chaperone TorD family protein [Candidatus Saccharimonadales bacterium]|nr:molecular chaperone TorD family protein [Candidatus Saccharimonadales bacterium]
MKTDTSSNTDSIEISAAYSRLAQIAGLRTDMYHLLALGFLDPTVELVSGLIDGTFRADVVATTTGLIEGFRLNGGIASKLNESGSTLSEDSFARDKAVLYQEMATEYARLFIGPGAAAVSPYETVQVDSGGGDPPLLMVSTTGTAVMAMYREANLNMTQGMNEPPDHIATELEFMYYLCGKEAASWQAGNNSEAKEWRVRQSKFANEHLCKWGIRFCEQVKTNTQQKFYLALSILASAFFQMESNREA